MYRVEGREAISEPFRYVIDLVRVDAANDPLVLSSDDVLGKNATLGIEVEVTEETESSTQTVPMMRNVHGVVEEFMVEEDPSSADGNHYRVVLVPRLAMLARNRQNRIHATSAPQTLEQIIRRKLRSSGPDYGSVERVKRVVLRKNEFRIDIDADDVPLAKLSHVAQYNETDLDFIRRLCERHGVYFFFASNTADPADPNDAEDTRGMVVFANTNTPFGVIRFEKDAPIQRTAPPVQDVDVPGMDPVDTNPAGWGPLVASYEENHKLVIELTLTGATGLTGGSTYTAAAVGPPAEPAELEGALFEFKSFHRPMPARVNVIGDQRVQSRDAEGNVTTLDLKRTATLDGGSGIYTDYDTHFVDEKVGDAFAEIRLQEIRAACEYSVGCTNSPCVAPGRTFTKKPRDDPQATGEKYLVTAVDIEVTHAHIDGMVDIDGKVIQTGISNRFRCIEFDEARDFVYRPPRVTPVPRLHGVQTAYIGTGATGEAGRPVLDEDGAYHIYQQFLDERVQFVDAEAELAIDKLSKAVRKGEPYAGDGVGMHFPLKRDTEVLVAYRNGDPDRPVIAAAMPGPLDHASPVTGVNPTSHVIETSSGARFEIHDDYEDFKSRIALRSRESSGDASYVRLGKADTTNASDPETLEDHYEKDVITVEKEELDGIALYTADNIREAAQKDKITGVKGTIRAHGGEDIYGRSVQKHLLRGRRMVIVSGEEADEPGDEANVRGPDNEVHMQDDDMFLLSKRNVYIKAHGDIHTTALASVTENVGGDEIKRTSGDSTSHHYGNSSKYIRGSSHNAVLGATAAVVTGPAVWGGCCGGLEFRGPTHFFLGIGFGFLTRHQLRLNVWTVKFSATEVLLIADSTLTEVKAMIEAESAAIDMDSSQTDCESTTTVVTADQLQVHV